MDFSSKKKKKPKKKAEEAEDDEEADVTDGVAAMAMEDDDDDDDDDDDGGDDGFDDDGAGGFVSIPADREYKYEELLDRMYSLLHANNPELAGDRKRFLIKPPQVVREGSKRVVLTNFGEICKTLNRSMDHVYAFMLAEMGTTGSIDASSRMVIKGRFPPKAIEQVGPRGRAKPPARCPPHTVPAARVATFARAWPLVRARSHPPRQGDVVRRAIPASRPFPSPPPVLVRPPPPPLLPSPPTPPTPPTQSHLRRSQSFAGVCLSQIIRRYVGEYVSCASCKSPSTALQKQNRLYFMQCNNCGARRSVTPIKTGFIAISRGARKKNRA